MNTRDDPHRDREDLLRFLRDTGHEPRIMPISGPKPAPLNGSSAAIAFAR